MQMSKQLLNKKFMINNLKYSKKLKKNHLLQFWILATMKMSKRLRKAFFCQKTDLKQMTDRAWIE